MKQGCSHKKRNKNKNINTNLMPSALYKRKKIQLKNNPVKPNFT